MFETIRTYIHQYNLLPERSPVVVGLSGGADSVALLVLLVRLGYKCIALHCNFHLRGEESDRDERFSRDLALQLGVPYYSTDFDTTRFAEANHLSIEMAARQLRYGWFEEKRKAFNAQAIAVAHHQDDSVETLLMNLMRGTGIRGLSGIRPKNGTVVRPLLAVGREEIERWLEEQGYAYMTDSTNLSDIYTRNFIRLRILPLMEELNPAVRQTIARTAENLSDAEAIYIHFIEEATKQLLSEDKRVSISGLLALPAPETVLYEILKRYGFSRIVSHEVYQSLSKESGKIFYSPHYRLIKDRDCLLLSNREEKNDESSYTVESIADFYHLPVEFACEQFTLSDGFSIEKDRDIAYFDLAKLRFPLTLRRWKEGDWFIPFGMTGKKKLSDYFSDHKYSRIEKENAWLLCSGKDIIWLVGERTDNRFRIEKTTKEVLSLKKMGQKPL
ncbi:tRNA lysidine(34) synthetase TilS [Parabacteroides sp. PF5-6]|uniref:tRNA lysidine(34) synthetase TilS n=1 Tax=Parabacteroides sp. PF5-6 TaxID=1742403 RepID=UPI002405C776|nr:tRNA lysidine(34) synthetase TilS [Parabacteroides sp. PF5-6]MDF9829662.1 tRNA(Ile)-lysidine synthase [Parabacteroides sp. PF5-6]